MVLRLRSTEMNTSYLNFAAGQTEEHVRTFAEVLAAIGTVGAVALALFLQVYLANRRRPRLNLSFSKDLTEEDWVPAEFPDHFDLLIRVRVNGQSGRDTAHNCQAVLLRVARPHADEYRAAVANRPLQWTDASTDTLSIHAGGWRRLRGKAQMRKVRAR